MKKTLLISLALMGSLLAFSGENTIQKTIPQNNIQFLSLSNINGSVTVKVHQDSTIIIKAQKKIGNLSPREAEKLLKRVTVDIQQSDKTIEIQTYYPRHTSRGGFFAWLLGEDGGHISVNYTLILPPHMNIDIRTTNGNIKVYDLAGKLELSTTNGSLKLVDIKGTINGRTTNGNIKASLMKINNESDLKLKTTNGNITLYIPDTLNLDIKARTTNGKVNCLLPLSETVTKTRTRLEGTINKGGTFILLKTTNGNVDIKQY